MNRWWWQVAWVSVAAVAIDLGHFHHLHTADSLVPVLASLYRWTPFYWEQNRYGLLVQLLATPFSHPLTNLLVQNGITIWAGLMAFPLAARYFVRNDSWTVAGPVAAAAFLLFAPLPVQWAYLSTFNVFPTSLALALAGLLAIEPPGRRPWRWLLAGVAFALAAWVNAAIAVLILPVVLAVGVARVREAPSGSRGRVVRELMPSVVMVGLTYPLAKALMRIPPPEFRTTWVSVPPVGDWLTLVAKMATDFYHELNPVAWAAFLAAALLVAVARPAARRDFLRLVLLAAALGGYVVLMAILFKGRWRYGIPAVVLLHAAIVATALGQLPARRWAAAVAGGAAVAAALVTFGLPSVAQVRQDLRRPANTPDDFAACVQALEDEKCTHVAGDYWFVWPAVFVRNLDAADVGEGPQLWGLTHRSWPTRDHWSAVPADRQRIAARRDDNAGEQWLDHYGIRTRPPRESGPLKVRTTD